MCEKQRNRKKTNAQQSKFINSDKLLNARRKNKCGERFSNHDYYIIQKTIFESQQKKSKRIHSTFKINFLNIYIFFIFIHERPLSRKFSQYFERKRQKLHFKERDDCL